MRWTIALFQVGQPGAKGKLFHAFATITVEGCGLITSYGASSYRQSSQSEEDAAIIFVPVPQVQPRIAVLSVKIPMRKSAVEPRAKPAAWLCSGAKRKEEAVVIPLLDDAC